MENKRGKGKAGAGPRKPKARSAMGGGGRKGISADFLVDGPAAEKGIVFFLLQPLRMIGAVLGGGVAGGGLALLSSLHTL